MIFHDFSLRYLESSGLSDVLVDKAIHDSWGQEIKVNFIGEKPKKGGFLNFKRKSPVLTDIILKIMVVKAG
ncbi:MAG: hypothetical protein HC908_05380 [Calothrix sp. SM1_7_51]|nr:hypothetical protein [Calothrix sp. SM1_7_51]